MNSLRCGTWREKIKFCIPRRRHGERCEDDPNIYIIFVLSQTPRNNKNEIEILVWSVHVAKEGQNKNNQTPLEDCSLEMCHKIIHMEISFEGLALECN